MIEKEEKDWFKLKRYPHIGYPINHNERHEWVENYILNPVKISKHSFLPFIHKKSKVKKFRKKYNETYGELTLYKKNGLELVRHPDTKERELYYASHLDSLIYSYYSYLLSIKYEEKIEEYNLGDVINAYRSIPIDKKSPHGSNKCNINFAEDVFNYIRDYPSDNFVAIAFDIKGFFDNLNHLILRKAWMNILDVEKLPSDHFNVFKNITRYSYVDIVDLFEFFKDKIICNYKNDIRDKSKEKRKKVSKLKYMRNQNAIAFCTIDEFLKNKNKLLKNSKRILINGKIEERNFGIPQGSPISSILANIYLLKFDRKINQFLNSVNGIYRRYSDDMVVICPKEKKDIIIGLMLESIKESGLTIQSSKTQVFHFERSSGVLKCGQEFEKLINWNKNFSYLGFEFDGNFTLLKSSSLSGYYRKMKRSINRSISYSKRHYKHNKGEIFKRRLLKKFTYKGAKRRRKWMWDNKKNGFIKTDFYDWGNFLSYAYKAAHVMKNNKIKQQTKRHWNIFNSLIPKKQIS
jgi:retron-type reverse transcriptase